MDGKSREDTFTILSIDDDPLFLQAIKRSLRQKPFHVFTAETGRAALDVLRQEKIRLILLDLQMPGQSGLTLLEELVRLYPDIPVLMLSGHGDVTSAVQAIKTGADDFLEKPFPNTLLLERLAPYVALWQQKSPQTEVHPGDFHFPDMVGDSPAMQRIKSLIVRIAGSEAPVLLLGESGTGKELAARAIHAHSPRSSGPSSGPFVAVDCAALNETVAESELFGHIRGAFTGAENSSLGLMRAADKGTLFLDEIGELPLAMQAKLLRSLQEREVRPVGEQRSYPVDIRVIAATNRDLEEEARNGRFRQDLYYRIAAIPLEMPALRHRREDIPRLAAHFLSADQKPTGKSLPESDRQAPARELSQESLQLLSGYHWPGNVRELSNVIMRALAFCESNVITPADLPATIAMTPAGSAGLVNPMNESLAAYEMLAFQNALSKCDGNRRCAASLLGISEATLYRKMKQFGLSK